MKIKSAFLQRWIVFFAALLLAGTVLARPFSPVSQIAVGDLPKEAQATLYLIHHGGPFPYEKDGVVFGNYERLLPQEKRGYYHEYTVKTPRARNRGVRRIIVGGNVDHAAEYFYTDDHYQSFRRIKE